MREIDMGVLEELIGPVEPEAAGRLRVFARMLYRTSEMMNLVSSGDRDRLGEHIVDCASLLSVVEIDGLSVVDLGSGAGLPAVVLAILRPGSEVTAVESRRRRAGFIKSAARRLGIANLSVYHGRIEDLGARGDGADGFDVATARALGSVGDVLEPALRVLAPAGRLVLYKGPRWPDERAEAVAIAGRSGFELGWENDVELPGVGRRTTFVEFHRRST